MLLVDLSISGQNPFAAPSFCHSTVGRVVERDSTARIIMCRAAFAGVGLLFPASQIQWL